MALGRIKVWTSGEGVTDTDLNAEFDNLIAGILAVDPGAAESITADLLADGANPQVFFGELFQDGAVIGTSDFIKLADTGLTVTISGGTAYVLQTSTSPDKLFRISIASSSTHTVLDNTTNFLDLGSDGVIDVVQSATAAEDHSRLLEVVAASGVISSTTDKADRTFLGETITGFSAENVDWEIDAVTTVTIKSGVKFRDTTNTRTFTFDADQTADITTSGANGLDQGSESANTWYAVVGIGDSSGVNVPKLLLVDATDYPSSIALPSGYDLFRRRGWVRNDGSSDFRQGQYYDNIFFYEEEISVLASGSDTSFTAVDSTTAMPPTTRTGIFKLDGNASGNYTVHVRTTGSGATAGLQLIQNIASINTNFIRTDISQNFDYIAVGSALNINFDVQGYVDTLEEDG